MSKNSSYRQILKASSIMGGAAGINMLLGMVRVKFAAILIGTTGVGLNASFVSLQGIIGTVAGLGIQSSAVREIAVAVGTGDQQAIGRAVLTLRRICWLTGLVGMAAMMLLSPLLSQLTFGHSGYTIDIAALGLAILFANLYGGQMALIQGTRRIGFMARANIIGAALSTVIALGLYAEFRLRGIVPTLVAVSAIQLALGWFYGRRVPVPPIQLGWWETFHEARDMVRLGLVFMWNGLMGSVVSYITVTLITQQAGVQAVGIYSAAFALSGMFVNFVLAAMSADYYPRLTGVLHDKAAMNRMVNEQTEIGLLLAVPGLLATMALAPWIIRFFYSNEFLSAVELMRWFVLGCLGRVITWPLGFQLLALGERKWFLFIEMMEKIIHTLMIAIGLRIIGLNGVAIAFPFVFLAYATAAIALLKHLTNFTWDAKIKSLIFLSITLLLSVFLFSEVFTIWTAAILNFILLIIVTVFCTHQVSTKTGLKFHKKIIAIPGFKFLINYLK